MIGLKTPSKYIISWEGSESTESLKLQILRNNKFPSGSYSLIDAYEDGVHTIAVKDNVSNCIFLVFRLRFELDDLDFPMIQFINKGTWYNLPTDDMYSFTLDYITKSTSKAINRDDTCLIYNLRLSVYDNESMDMLTVTHFYNNLKSADGTVKEAFRVYEGDLDYREDMPPYKMFGSKTALKLRLASLGRKGI